MKSSNRLSQDNQLIDLRSHAIIRLQNNAKTAEFLQGQITADIEDVTTTHSKLAAICNNKGRVTSLFRIVKDQDDYLLCLPNDYHLSLSEHLKKYGVFAQLTFALDNRFTVHYGITGKDWCLQPNILPTHIDQVWSDKNITIIKTPGFTDRFEILATKSQDLNSIMTVDLCQQQALNVWHAMDFAMGLTHIEQANLAMQTPHNLNLKAFNAISFDKGCYIGQEIVAKMEHLGRVKKIAKPALISATTDSQLGSPILNAQGKQVGDIINTISFTEDTQLILGIFPVDQAVDTFFDQNNNGFTPIKT